MASPVTTASATAACCLASAVPAATCFCTCAAKAVASTAWEPRVPPTIAPEWEAAACASSAASSAADDELGEAAAAALAVDADWDDAAFLLLASLAPFVEVARVGSGAMSSRQYANELKFRSASVEGSSLARDTGMLGG